MAFNLATASAFAAAAARQMFGRAFELCSPSSSPKSLRAPRREQPSCVEHAIEATAQTQKRLVQGMAAVQPMPKLETILSVMTVREGIRDIAIPRHPTTDDDDDVFVPMARSGGLGLLLRDALEPLGSYSRRTLTSVALRPELVSLRSRGVTFHLLEATLRSSKSLKCSAERSDGPPELAPLRLASSDVTTVRRVGWRSNGSPLLSQPGCPRLPMGSQRAVRRPECPRNAQGRYKGAPPHPAVTSPDTRDPRE